MLVTSAVACWRGRWRAARPGPRGLAQRLLGRDDLAPRAGLGAVAQELETAGVEIRAGGPGKVGVGVQEPGHIGPGGDDEHPVGRADRLADDPATVVSLVVRPALQRAGRGYDRVTGGPCMRPRGGGD